MSTEFINDQWRLPNAWNGSESNVNKQSNYSMDFDGSSQYVDSNLNISSYSEFSVSLWLKRSNSTAYVVGQWVDGTSSNQSYVIQLYNNNVYFNIRNSSLSVNSAISTTSLNNTDWYHIGATWDGSNIKIYINGTLEDTTSCTTMNNPSSTIVTRIGGASGGSLTPFNGQIDAVSIFNYALSSSQVTTLYGSSSTGIGNPMSLSPKPVAYYPLGDQDAFNGASYLTPNSSLKDYVFSFTSNSKISAGNITSLNSVSNASYSFWFKATSSTGYPTAGALIGTANTSATTAYFYNNTLYIHTLYGGFITTSIPALNQWHHVCCTFNAGSSEAFINGVSVGTKTGEQSTTNANAGTDFSIGYSPNYNFYFVNGQISNVSLFNTTLPATGTESVQSLYNYGTPPDISSYSGLQGWWKLDASATYDGSNWTIPDDSTNSNTGTSSGMTQANLVQSDLSFTSGYSPYALDFDGTNDYIQIPYNANLTPQNGNFTISAWINTDNLSGWHAIWCTQNLTSSTIPLVALHTYGNKVRATVGGSTNNPSYAGSWALLLDSTQSLTTSTWYHIAVSYNMSGNAQIYINGSADNSGPIENPQTSWNTGDRFIGEGEVYWDGRISNLSIWNTALTSTQVTEIYNEGVPSNLNNHSAYSNLVSWWQLGSNSSFNTNWTVLDEKGTNNGTSANMTEDDIVDGVGSYANGVGTSGLEVIGSAPFSDANSLSVNMDVLDRSTDVPN